MIMGDFNEILNIEDRKGQIRTTNSMIKFRDFIGTNQLKPLELFGRKFTSRRGVSRSKIDWVLCHASWINKFP